MLQGLYAEGVPGEQHEFTAYGLLLAAAHGRSVLAHEMSDALAASGSGMGAALAAGGRYSGGAGGGGKDGSGGSGSGSRDGGRQAASSGGGGGSGAVDDVFVPHALAVCRAYLEGNFVAFLRLYEGAPRMAPYLMDALLGQLRGRAYSE